MSAVIHKLKTPFYSELEQRFAEHLDCVKDAEPDWFTKARQAAYERFAETGFPTKQDEAWKYTRLTALEKQIYTLHERVSIGAKTISQALPEALLALDCYKIVCVAGYVHEGLSDIEALPKGVLLASLSSGSLAENWKSYYSKKQSNVSTVADYNLAFASDGVVLSVAKGVVVDKPIVFVHLDESGDDYSCHMRHHITLEQDASAQVIYYYGTLDEDEEDHEELHCWDNYVSVVDIGKNANLQQWQLQERGGSVFHTVSSDISIAERGQFHGFYVSHGLHLGRNEVYGSLEGEGAECHLKGIGLGRLDQCLDTYWPVYHHVPGASSSQLYKSVLDDESKGVFYGKVVVPKDAQHSDAHQLNHNLLLSDTAHAYTRPELEIAANDVTCSHGASVGQLDDHAMYYLTSRGLSKTQAKALLVQGFIEEMFEDIEHETIQALFHASVFRWLKQDHIIEDDDDEN